MFLMTKSPCNLDFETVCPLSSLKQPVSSLEKKKKHKTNASHTSVTQIVGRLGFRSPWWLGDAAPFSSVDPTRRKQWLLSGFVGRTFGASSYQNGISAIWISQVWAGIQGGLGYSSSQGSLVVHAPHQLPGGALHPNPRAGQGLSICFLPPWSHLLAIAM